MIFEDNTLLKPFRKIVLDENDKKKYEISYNYFNENKYKFFFLYNSSILGFLFKKKRKEFMDKTSYFDAISNHNALYLAYKMAELIAKEDYKVDSLSHYTFNIDGKEEIFGICEIHPCIFYTAKVLKSKMKNEVKKEGVIVNLSDIIKNKESRLNEKKDIVNTNNVIPFNFK